MHTDIQKGQHPQLNFIQGGVRFNIESVNWKELKLRSTNQFQNSFFNFDFQSYAFMKNSIFTFGTSSSNSNQGALYSHNIVSEQTKQWSQDKETNTPPLRQNYGLIMYDGRLCMFGGRRQNHYFNDLMSFCSYSNIWLQVIKEQKPLLPSPRVPFIFVQVGNGNLLLFGGRNEQDKLKDAFLLVNWAWKPLKLGGTSHLQQTLANIQQIINLQGISYASSRGHVYLFGGTNGKTYSNQLYKISVHLDHLYLNITKVLTDSGPRPCSRAYHSMQKLGQNCLVVYGGTNGQALRDLTMYDVNQSKWIQIYPLNGPLPVISKVKAINHYNTLYLIGELIEKHHITKCIMQLSFPQFQLVKSQICTNCVKRLQIKQKQQTNGPKKPFISNGLMYNMAIQISFPFQAFSLLIDCAQALNATQISIKSLTTKDRFSYLDIRFNGKSLNRQQFSSIVSHSYKQDATVLQIIDKIKLGAMRLGKTLMYITIQNNFRRVFLFSADSLIISHYDQVYAYYTYQQRISDQWLATQQSILHKKHIINLLKSYFENPFTIINSVAKHCLLIFQNNVIMTSQKVYYGELISTPNDINLCKNTKKVQFLDNIGFQLNNDPQVSLTKYLQYLFIKTKIQTIQVQNKLIHLNHNKYQAQLDNLQHNNKIKNIYKNTVNVKGIQAECSLYEVIEPSQYIKQLKGILVYYKDRLVNRFQINFGDLFWQKFYKTKYRNSFGLWTSVGIINIKKGVQLKSLGNEFKNEGNYNFFVRYIKKQILFKLMNQKNQNVIDLEQSKSIKLEKKQKQ